MGQIDELRRTVERLHECSATHTGSAQVEEAFRGETVWKGQVEIFDIEGHPKALLCYAWAHDTDTGKTKYQAVLKLPPVNSPVAAVRAAIVSEFRDDRKEN